MLITPAFLGRIHACPDACYYVYMAWPKGIDLADPEQVFEALSDDELLVPDWLNWIAGEVLNSKLFVEKDAVRRTTLEGRGRREARAYAKVMQEQDKRNGSRTTTW